MSSLMGGACERMRAVHATTLPISISQDPKTFPADLLDAQLRGRCPPATGQRS
jgi:hypothetical protein